MADFMESLQKTPPKQKAAAVALLVVGMGVVYYFLFYGDFETQGRSLNGAFTQMETDVQQYEARKRDYMRFKNEVARLLEEQKDLLRVLPKKAEIPTFLDSIYNQAEPLGLEITLFSRQDEKPQDLYIRIPVQIELVGSYHQIARFFNKVGQLPRIVNIEDVTFSDPAIGDNGVRLKARFNAVTFRFADKPGAAAPRKG
ncbi:MAG TPA: type 4a pilus biogenesis protein PilO [Polyangia bacterium]|jgi:type IV pilus assembly protein PilO